MDIVEEFESNDVRVFLGLTGYYTDASLKDMLR